MNSTSLLQYRYFIVVDIDIHNYDDSAICALRINSLLLHILLLKKLSISYYLTVFKYWLLLAYTPGL